MPFRVSYQYQQQMAKLAGWTENFWNGKTDLTATKVVADTMRGLLNPIHGNTTFLTGVRISDASSFRDVDLTLYPLTARGDAVVSRSDYATTSLLLKLTGLGNYKTRQWLKGIWDGVIDDGGYYTPTPAYTTRINNLLSHLQNGANGWVMRVIDRTQPFKPIKDISQAGVVTCTGHGFLDNAIVRISRVRGLRQANGRWRITRIDADTFQVQGWVAPILVTPYLGNGVVRLQTYIFVAISEAKIVRATEHKVGRPLEQLTGRRRVRAT